MLTYSVRLSWAGILMAVMIPNLALASEAASSTTAQAASKASVATPKVALDDLLGKPESSSSSATGAASSSTVQTMAMSAMAVSGGSSTSAAQNFAKTLAVDSRSGSPVVAIPLYIPTGRGGMSPSMGLTYSPLSGNGPFGWGWNMDMGAVVRSTKNGVPNYDNTDTFLVSLGGKNFELISLGSNNEYRSKFDDDRVRFFFNSGVWSAKDKSGTTYYFGSRTGSTVTDGATKVFKWKLDRIEDLFGNVLVVDYTADQSFQVRYGLKVGKSTTTDVNDPANFAYVIDGSVYPQDRSDVVTDFKAGFAVSERRLISTLTIKGGGNLVKKYSFNYSASAKTGRSLLRSVTETGSNGTTSQPVINLQYNDTATIAYSVSSITDPISGDNSWVCTMSGSSEPTWQITPTGKLTLAGRNSSTTCQTYMYVANATTLTVPVTGETNSLLYSINDGPMQSGKISLSWPLVKGYNLITVKNYNNSYYSVTLNADFSTMVDLMNSSQVVYPQLAGDFNGDGKSDVATYFSSTGTVKVALSNGTGFLPKATWLDGFAIGKNLLIGDFNGDGRTDLAAYDSSAGTVRVALSNGSQFVDSGIWLSGVPAGALLYAGDFNGDGRTDLYIVTSDASGVLLQIARSTGTAMSLQATSYRPHLGTTISAIIPADLNGDGLTDLIGFDQSSGTWSVHLNINGFGDQGYYSTTGFASGKAPIAADFNQDGRADIGYFDAANKQIVYLPSTNNGFGSQQTKTFAFTLTDPATTQLQTADFNGDGINDFMTFNSMGKSDLAISSGTKFQDLVTSYDNGFGGQLSLTYASASDYTNNYLPFAVPVVSSVTASNNLGDTFTTSYSYSGGLWNATEREMYGFREARVIDADGNYSLSRFNQDNLYMRGHPDRTAIYGADGTLYQETKYQWNNDPVISGRTDVRFVSPARVDNYVYDTSGTAANVRTAVESTYDITLGVPTEIRDYGQVDWSTGTDIGTDYIRTDSAYSSNSDVSGILVSKIAYDISSNILAKSYAYYDGATTLGSVVKGLLTRSDVWNKVGTTESLASTTNTYNSYGQLLTTVDPLIYTTSVTYDTTWSMFPMVTTDAKGFTKTNAYYGVNSVALTGGIWGLLKSVTDANNQTTTTNYDALGRVTKVINPLDTSAGPTVAYQYQTNTNYRVIITKRCVYHDTSSPTLDSYTFIDGLGRTLAVKTYAATAGKYVVSGQTTLNSRGLVVKDYFPYLSTSAIGVLELPNVSRSGTTYDYDALGRRTKTTFADSTYASYSYTPVSNTVIDPNGHKTAQVRDARGRIVRVEEYSGSDGRSTLYPAQAFSLYAATNYTYNVMGNLLSVTDALGNVTAMTYDALGRKLTMNDPDMQNVSYQYDAVGQLTRQTDAKSVPFAFTYDALGRVLTKARYDTGGDLVTYAYDTATNFGKGRLAQASYPAGNASFNYDAIGEEVSSAKLVDSSIYNVTRTYDALGRLASLTYPDGKSKVVYGYDHRFSYRSGLLNTVELKVTSGGTTTSQNIVTAITYTANGSISQITYGNGAVATYTYDANTLRLQSQVVDTINAVVQSYTYSYDPAGNIVQVVDAVRSVTKTYTYDALNRMITSNDGSGQVSYQYNQIGNLTQKGSVTYTYGQNGAGKHAVTSLSDGTTMTYDANGNLTVMTDLAKTQYYTYDTSNRLTMVEAVDAGTTTRYPVASFTYDGDGGRTTKTVYPNKGASSVATRYVGDLYESSGGAQTDYIFMGGTRVAAYDASGARYRWFIGDNLGSTNVVLDETSAVKERIEYTPWGEVKSYDKYGTSPEIAWFYFTGKRLDDETGLVYFGARYYNPKLARFITADSTIQHPYDPQDLNRYSYCRNNPINMVDPTGYGFFSKVWNSLVDNVGSFVGSVIGATIGATVGFTVGGPPGALIGAYIGANIGGGIGYSTQHGGNMLQNIGNSFTMSFQELPYAAAGYAIAGPIGAIIAVSLHSGYRTYKETGSLEDAMVSTTSTGIQGAAGYYATVKLTEMSLKVLNSPAPQTQQTPRGQKTVTVKSYSEYNDEGVMRPVPDSAGVSSQTGDTWWQYYPIDNPNYKSNWIALGVDGKPPVLPGPAAVKAFNLPPWNPGTGARQVYVSPFQPVAGPRTPLPQQLWKHFDYGTEQEYFLGDDFPEPK